MFKKILAFVLIFCLCIGCAGLSANAAKSTNETTPTPAKTVKTLGAIEGAEDVFEKVSENDTYALYLISKGSRAGEFYMESKVTGTKWYSNPTDRDFSEEGLAKSPEASSQFTITVYNVSSKSRRNYNSYQGTDKNKKITFAKTANGYLATYKLVNGNITIKLHVEVTGNGLAVSSDFTSSSKDIEKNILTDISLLPCFGASLYGEEGYMLVPDGSGALVYNNNGKKKAKAVNLQVYGTDKAFSVYRKSTKTVNTALPVFGIKNENTSLFAAIEEGASSAYVNAVSATEAGTYNRAYFSFKLVGSDTVSLDATGGNSQLTGSEVYAPEEPLLTFVKVAYLPLEKGSGYSEMADYYRDYLGFKKGEVASTPSLFLEIYGGINKEESFYGIPMTRFKKLTTVKQAKTVATELSEKVSGELVISYLDMDSSLISGKIQNKFSIKGSLGNKNSLKELQTLVNGNLYLEHNVLKIKKGGNGFSPFRDNAVRISGSTIFDAIYDICTGVSTDSRYYISKPTTIAKIVKKYNTSMEKNGFNSAYVNLATFSTSDFNNKKYTSRGEGIEALKAVIAEVAKDDLLYAPNDYALGIGKYLTDIPVNSSSYDLTDEDVPFYQLVMSGVKEYSTVSLNEHSNLNKLFLKAVESGSSIKFSIIYNDVTVIKDTDYEYLFGASYSARKEQIIEYQNKLEDVFAALGSRVVKDHVILDGGVRLVTFEGDKQILINFGELDAATSYGTVKANDYLLVERGED